MGAVRHVKTRTGSLFSGPSLVTKAGLTMHLTFVLDIFEYVLRDEEPSLPLWAVHASNRSCKACTLASLQKGIS
jgi:hypothetical protein